MEGEVPCEWVEKTAADNTATLAEVERLVDTVTKKGNKHYRECNDQLLSGFIRGVALRRKN